MNWPSDFDGAHSVSGAPSGTGSREPSPAVSALPGFDPSRGDKPRRRIELKVEIDADDWSSVRRALRLIDERILREGGAIIMISGGYDSGYAICASDHPEITHDVWLANLDSYIAFIDARDRDGSPKGEDADAASFTTARAEGIAKSQPENPAISTTPPEIAA